jgi:hypothetical protein
MPTRRWALPGPDLRTCGRGLIADALGKPMAEIGTYRLRAPFKPITLVALADLPT